MPQPFLKNAPESFMWPPSREELDRRGFQTGDSHLLGLNEVVESPSPRVQAALAEHWSDIGRYPEAGNVQLRELIESHTRISPGCQLWTAGLSDMLLRLMITVKTQEGRLVMPSPNFWGYEKLANSVGTQITRVPLHSDAESAGAADVSALLDAISDDTTVVSVTTPCNPTGVSSSAQELERLASGVPDDVLLFVDEAYHEFAVFAGHLDALDIIRRARPNGLWVIGRTFSKAYALAGARVGYGLCSDARTANYLRSHSSEFNVSRYAQVAAFAAMQDQHHQRLIMSRCATERERLIAGLQALSLAPYPSITNFVSVHTPNAAVDVVQAMASQGVFIARWMEPGHEHMLRLSVGSASDTDATLNSLHNILG